MLALVLLLAADVDPVQLEAARAAARAAVDGARWCDASFYDEQLAAMTGKTSGLYNAAEDAYAADDRARALGLYRSVQSKDAEKKLKPEQVAARIAELEKRLKSGPGTVCAAPAPVCGNGFVEVKEACDDADADDADGCAQCQVPTTPTPVVEPAPVPLPPPPPGKPLPTGVLLLGGGGALVVAGAVSSIVGVMPLLTFQSTDAALQEREATLADPGDLPEQQAQAKADFESWGQVALFAGLGAVVVGAAVAVTGLVLPDGP